MQGALCPHLHGHNKGENLEQGSGAFEIGVCIFIWLPINLAFGERACAFSSKAHSGVWLEHLTVVLIAGMGWPGFSPTELYEDSPSRAWVTVHPLHKWLPRLHSCLQPTCHVFRQRGCCRTGFLIVSQPQHPRWSPAILVEALSALTTSTS